MALPVVRLSPDYSAPSPLWNESPRAVMPADAMVPPALLAELVAWQQDFDENFHWEKGWRSVAARDRWASDAHRLEAQVRRALAGKAELIVDLWPLKRSG